MQNALGRFIIQRAILKTGKAKPFLGSLFDFFLVSSEPILMGFSLQISSPFLPGFRTRASPFPKKKQMRSGKMDVPVAIISLILAKSNRFAAEIG